MAQYPVWVGSPIFPGNFVINGPNFVREGTNSHFYVNQSLIPPTTNSYYWCSYYWSLKGAMAFSGSYTNTVDCYVTATSTKVSTGYLFFNATNTCGTTPFESDPIVVGGTAGSVTLTPNPASSNVQVSISNNPNSVSSSDTTSTISPLITSNQNATTSYTVNIISSLGVTYYSNIETSNMFTLSVGNLPNGTYFVLVIDSQQNVYNSQLIVKH